MSSNDQYSSSVRRATLVVASFASFVTPFIGSATNIALPAIGKQFDADALTLGWVATSFLLSCAVFLVPFGRLADIHGRKKVFNAGLGIYTVSSVSCALAWSVEGLIALRVVQGLGAAMIFGTSTAMVTSVFPPQQRGKALGIVIASVYLGLTLGPFAGGFLTMHLGWPSIFLSTVPLGLAALGLSLAYLKTEWADARGESFDLAGSLIFGVSISVLMYGFSRLPSTIGGVCVGGGLTGVVVFVLFERSRRHPVLNVGLFMTNRVFAFSNFAALINYAATFAISFLLSLYLQYIKGMNPQQAGQVLIAQPVLMALFSPLAGRLSDRVDPRIVASAGMALISAGLFALAFLQRGTGIPFIVVILVVFGIGYALFSSPNTNAIMSSVERRYYGIASGTVGTMRLLGQMSSMGIAMLVFSVFIGDARVDESNAEAFVEAVRTAFLIFAVLCFVGVFFSLARGRKRAA